MLRREGLAAAEATNAFTGKTVPGKKELLSARGINYDELPASAWQIHGVSVVPDTIEQEGFDPGKHETTACRRQTLTADYELPGSEKYGQYIHDILKIAPAYCRAAGSIGKADPADKHVRKKYTTFP